MRAEIKKVFIWLGLSFLMLILWISGIALGNVVFPSNLMEMASDSNNYTELLFFLICGLNTWIIMYFIYNSRINGWKLAGILFLVTFGIQYFMSQIESLWFNDSLKLPINGIWAIISGGAVMYLLFAPIATWLTGKFNTGIESQNAQVQMQVYPMAIRIILLSVVVWPLIYFLAGYLIAWQFDDVRMFYSGTTDMDPFLSIMKENFDSGLYFFQIIRGFLWILIGFLVLNTAKGSWIHKGIILGLLITILGSSGLLLPNPVMPYAVRMAHFVETAPSGFIWGIIIAWVFRKF